MPRLKVFQTTSGIHDHIVATTSRPAALKAWGARTDLFSMGVASEVTDPKVRKKALDRPGEVIRISRSGTEEPVTATRRKARKASTPKPNRKKLDAAEKKLAELKAQQQREIMAIDRQLRALQRKRDEVARRQDKAHSAAEAKVEAAQADYDAALEDWNPGG